MKNEFDFGEVRIERWEENEYVITCKLGCLGKTLSKKDAETVLAWFKTAIPEIKNKI